MTIEDLTLLEVLQGVFSLIWVIIAMIIGLRILLKASTLGRRDLMSVGISLILIASPWWNSSLSFVLYVLFNFTLNDFFFFLIGNIFLPFAILCWMYTFCSVLNIKYKKFYILIYFIIGTIWQILFIYFLFIDIETIGTIEGLFDSRYNTFALIYHIFMMLSLLITGIIFANDAIKSPNRETQWKGKFILIGILTFVICAFFDSAISLNPLTLVFIRILLISSAIEYYFGFFLPKQLKKRLIGMGDSN